MPIAIGLILSASIATPVAQAVVRMPDGNIRRFRITRAATNAVLRQLLFLEIERARAQYSDDPTNEADVTALSQET
jgi:hypothetical protein